MKIAYTRGWQVRLLLACLFSLALHLASLAWLPGTMTPPHAPEHAPLAVRLHSPAPARSPHRLATLEPSATVAARRRAEPPSPPATPAPARLATWPVAARAADAAGSPAPATDAGDPLPPSGEADLTPMPRRYRVRMPPPALISYTLVRSAPGQSARAVGTASIAWQHDGDHYQLRVTGVLGSLASRGHSGDAGILPVEAREENADGGAVTRFDEDGGNITFSASQRSYAFNAGSQDRASVLMQLAGIGLEEPDQMLGRLEVFVAGASDAAVARYQVLGQEQVETGLGRLESWHLVQLSAAGQPRLELWLAPAQHWYPVQLRVTEPDGTVATQVLRTVEPPPSLP